MSAILGDLALVVGTEHVRAVDSEESRAAERTTFAFVGRVHGIVRPGTVDEVAACFRAAGAVGAALYPSSAGRNWGYGSRKPPRSGAVVLDLSRLDRITDYDEELGYVTLECGVTFGQLADYLRARGDHTFASVTGGPPDSSVLGNLVERGLGKGPLADRFAHACGFEVVLPTGEVVETGFARFPAARSAAVHRWGVGPTLDGLFSQSNLGVVTRATIWLKPRPRFVTSFIYKIEEDEGLAPLIDALRTLRLEGTLASSVLVGNDVRRISFARQYPWAEMDGRTPISKEVRRALRRTGAWSGDGTVYAATERLHDAQFERIEELLGRVGAPVVRVGEPRAGDPASIALGSIQDLALGRPLERSVETAYFRKRTPPPEHLDPDRDRCGLVWFSPAIPFRGADARIAADLIEEIYPQFGFDPNIGFNCVSDRAIDMTPMILFDRDVPGEDERAAACHRAAFEAFAARGYYPYRLTIESMAWLPQNDAFARLVHVLKRAMDPHRTLAPGRYDFDDAG